MDSVDSFRPMDCSNSYYNHTTLCSCGCGRRSKVPESQQKLLFKRLCPAKYSASPNRTKPKQKSIFKILTLSKNRLFSLFQEKAVLFRIFYLCHLPYLTVSVNKKFECGKLFKSHRSSCMKLLGRDAYLRTKPELSSVCKSC